MLNLQPSDPLAVATITAIHNGDLEALKRLLADHPPLATARICGADNSCGGGMTSRTLLHVATDWPGNFPNGATIVTSLIAVGAEVNARFTGPHPETPLHWAASSDNVEVLDALLDSGADIEAPGAVIGAGTPLSDAVAFGQWRAARRLVERGAQTTLWQAAALGHFERIEAYLVRGSASELARWSPRSARLGASPPDEITHAFWCACHGGQQRTAELLLAHGADPNWIGYDGLTPLDAARRSDADTLVDWLRGQGAKPAYDVR